ncbi:MAG: Gmad2 immunoglobulin-like domain-containing protein [Acidothermaceae bacterium]
MSDRAGRNGPDRPGDETPEETARRLRDALAHEASAVQPSADGLRVIREKIRADRRGHRAWLRPLAVGTAALATAAVAVIVVVVVKPQTTGDNTHPAPLASSPPPSSSPVSSPPASPAASAGKPHPVTIFYVGKLKDPQQLLFSQTVTRPWPAANAFVGDAVTAMLTTTADDPDYLSYWPAGTTVRGVSIQNGTEAVVDLSTEAGNPDPDALGMGAISAQQLFYTVHGAAPKIDSVELRIDGKPVTSLWGSTIADPITAEPAWQVFSHVWINSPADNATVAPAVTIKGDATVFEGTVSWQVLMHGDVLQQGAAQATAGAPEQGTWSVNLTLTAGTYTIRAFESSAKDGSPTYVDDKVITVQ